jgi:hypothetical protein
MALRIATYIECYWHNAEDALARCDGLPLARDFDPITGVPNATRQPCYDGRFGLREWHRNQLAWFDPAIAFIACGTWSEPAYCPLPIPVINSGAEPTKPAVLPWNYSSCAFSAACYHLLNTKDWDLAVHITDDMLVGPIDWQALLTEFMERPEEILATRWYTRMDWPLAMKRNAVIRFAHQRCRTNLLYFPFSEDAYLEEEMMALWGGCMKPLIGAFVYPECAENRWWCPWPDIPTIRQDHGINGSPHPPDDEAMNWPIVRLPTPTLIPRYEAQWKGWPKPLDAALAKPFLAP